MLSSATLMERPKPYPLVIELARGKVNQLRGQAADWGMGGLLMPEILGRSITEFRNSVNEVQDEIASATK